MSSLERLIDLAKRTGDRLIVHNPYENQDVVIMGVDEYERLALKKQDVRELSSGQLLDQINRDIAIWRANKQLDEEFEKQEMLDKELAEQGPFDPFAELDSHVPEWHTAGAVLGNRYNDFNFCEDCEEEPEEDELNLAVDDIPNFGVEDKTEEVKEVEKKEEEKTKIPFMVHEDNVWKEEPLSDTDEPVFYEEPV